MTWISQHAMFMSGHVADAAGAGSRIYDLITEKRVKLVALVQNLL